MHPLKAAEAFFRTQKLQNCHVTAALSGGADSVCLLSVLLALRRTFSLEIDAIHIQHGLRGKESLEDEQFCRVLCSRLCVPLTVVSVDVRSYAAAHRCSVETAARECRYAAFSEHCSSFVATAHTASDNLETMLFRITRGTGLRGLCGIPPRREQFLRPLLQTSREEVEAYLQECGLSYVTDSTNLSDAYTRNFLRLQVVPLLKKCNPSLEKTNAAMLSSLRSEQDFLEGAAEAAYTECLQEDGSLSGLHTLHPAMQQRCIALFLKKNGIDATFQRITAVQSLLVRGGSTELIRGNVTAHVSRNVLFLTRNMPHSAACTLQLGENSIFSGLFVNAELIMRRDSVEFARIHKKFTKFVLDYDIIEGYAELHGRIPGLRIRLPGRAHSLSIKKWLNADVPPAKRAYVHYLSDAGGLLWAEGLGAAERAAVTERTERMLLLTLSHCPDTNCAL
jgi:tRNA(Ile)-lysidine synthase